MAKKKKTKAKRAAAKPAKAAEPLVVASKVRNYIKAKGLRTSGETVEALNARVCEMLDTACQRAEQNKRATVQPQDL